MPGPLRAVELTCERRTDPLGIDLERGSPRLGWRLVGDGLARRQTAYRIQAARTVEALATGDLSWDSGFVAGERSQWVPYRGPRLRSRDRIAWRVRAWDEADRRGPWSSPAVFEMGLLRERDWRARWIAPILPPPEGDDQEPRPFPAPLLRTEFALATSVQLARAYICGLGFHELRLNGRRVGDHVLEPAFTRYDARAEYTTYDVSEHLREGRNAIGVVLGRGWFDEGARQPWWFAQAPWRTRPRLRLQLEVTLADGSRRRIVSDRTWSTSPSPIRWDGVRTGETYDARLEQPGWDEPGFDDARWGPVRPVPGPGGRLVAQTSPIRVTETLPAASVERIAPGVHVVDFGRNLAGWSRIRAEGVAGTPITLRHGERLGDDGDLDQTSLARYHDAEPFQRDVYITKGGAPEVWEPRFTYHGFRYLRVDGFPGLPGTAAFEARVVHSAYRQIGRFASSHGLLNRIHAAARHSFDSNFVGFPTSEPHREKNGWTGDAHLCSELGLYHVDVADGYRTWLDAMSDVQRRDGSLPAIVPTGGWGYSLPPGDDVAGPAWDSACIQLPWTLYRFTGDASALSRYYPMMTRYLGYLAALAEGYIVEDGIGDWCPPGGPEAHRTPVSLTSTAFFHADASIVAEIAVILGRPRDAQRYRKLAEHIKAAFNRRFLDAGTGWYEGHEMTAQAAALFNGLVDEAVRERVVARLLDAVAASDHHPAFGILGARWVLRVLSAAGHADVAFRMATQTTFPSWGHWLMQGATTLWERWEGVDSLNHPMFGDVAAWMMATLAGIEPDPRSPGFGRVSIKPRPVDGLDWVEGEVDTPYGRVRSAWRRAGASVLFDVDVPANTSALVSLPAREPGSVSESGKPLAVSSVRLDGVAGDCLGVAVGSGSYRFAVAT